MDPGALISFDIRLLEDDLSAWLPPDVLKEAMMEALTVVEDEIKTSFTARQGSWTPLARSTQLQRMRQGYGPTSPILVRSGVLRDNVASGHEVSVNSTEITGGTYPNDDAQAPYSKVSIGDYLEGLNNQREFFTLSDDQEAKVFNKFIDIISDKLELE